MNAKKGKYALSKSAAVASLVLAVVISGCGNNAESNSNNNSNTGNAGSSTEQPVQEVSYPASLSYWTDAIAPDVTKIDSELNVKNELEKITGTKVDYQYPTGDANEALNLMIATNNLPDVIETNWLAKGPDQLIKDKTIIRLNELIEQHAPNLTKLLNEHPDWKKAITTDDGNIYVMPFIREHKDLTIFMGPIIRQDWLDTLELAMPTTIDEWNTVLTAFKNNDPNGNGKADEIPLLLQINPTAGNLLGSFGLPNGLATAWGVNSDFYQVDGKVKYGPIQPEYKEFLIQLNQWYKDGVLDKEFASVDNKLRDARITSDTVGSFVGYASSGIAKYMGLMKEKNPNFKLVGAPFPVLNKGDKAVIGLQDAMFKGYGAAVTSGNPNPAETIKYLDYMYSDEGYTLINYGIEGKTYEMVNGVPTFTELVTKDADGLSVGEAKIKYGVETGEGAYIQSQGVQQPSTQLPEQLAAVEAWGSSSNERLLPYFTQTGEEDKEMKPLLTDMNTYFTEMFVKFVIGVESLDNFDKFVKTMQGMGADRVVELKQAALDRYNQR
ncbi:extracellular solute-binding protein [Paenibacillus sp. strain BS8-2]